MMRGSPLWLRIVVGATALIFAAVAIYVFGFEFTARLHPDDTVIVFLADKALHAKSPVATDWYYANGEIWVIGQHLLALLPVAIAGVTTASLWASLVIGFVFQLAVLACCFRRLASEHWVAALAVIATSIAWSHSHIDFEYVQLAYGFGACMYLLAFTQLAGVADGATPRRGLLFGAVLVAVFAMENPPRTMVFMVVPVLVACAWPWRGVGARARIRIAGTAVGAWLLAFALYKLVLVRVVTFAYPAGYVAFELADAKRIVTNFHLLRDGLVALCGGDGSVVRAVPGFAVVCGAIALVVRDVISTRVLTARRFVGAVLLTQLVLVLALSVFGTVLSNETSVRYLIPSLISLVGIAILVAVEAFGSAPVRARRFAVAWLVAIPIAALVAVPDARPQPPLAAMRPDGAAIAPIAEALARRGLHRGFAIHLAASLLTVESGGDVVACPVTFWHAIIPSRWLTDTSYFDRATLPDRFFVVAGRTQVERDAIQLTLGPAIERFTASDTYDIYVYRTADTDMAWLDLPIRDGDDAVFPMHLPAKHLQLVHDKAVLAGGDLVATGEQGTIVYGPYIALPRGNYDISWIGNGIESTGELEFAVTATGGRTTFLARAKLDPTKVGRERAELVRMRVKLATRRDNVEVIATSHGGARVALHELVIEKLP